jgi:hypothetical protein
LFNEKLKNPFAARELLTALKSPGARFFNMGHGLSNQLFRVLQDTDRALVSMGNVSALRPDSVRKRHDIELRLVKVIEDLASVTVEVAVQARVKPHLLQETTVRTAVLKRQKQAERTSGTPATVGGTHSGATGENFDEKAA